MLQFILIAKDGSAASFDLSTASVHMLFLLLLLMEQLLHLCHFDKKRVITAIAVKIFFIIRFGFVIKLVFVNNYAII
jgi:hypothetical protein